MIIVSISSALTTSIHTHTYYMPKVTEKMDKEKESFY